MKSNEFVFGKKIKLIYIGHSSDMGLTNRRVYDGRIISSKLYSDKFYQIDNNDDGFSWFYFKTLFKTLEDIRNEKILNILNDEE